MEKIGFIGLGIMGKPMAHNLLRAGYPLFVHNRSRPAEEELAAAGATACASPREVAERANVVITMVPDSPDVEQVCFGPDGIIHGLSPGMLYVDMSTIAAATAREVHRRFAERGVEALDAPVSGGDAGARAGTVSIMAGGSAAAFRRAEPIFGVLGGKVSHMGEAGAGQVTKSCNQVATALATQGVIEALTLARKAGVDPARVRQAMLGGFAQSKALDIAGAKMIARDFTPGFKTHLYRKDLGIALQTGRALAVPLTGAALVAAEMDALIARGAAEEDFSALLKVTENLAGL